MASRRILPLLLALLVAAPSFTAGLYDAGSPVTLLTQVSHSCSAARLFSQPPPPRQPAAAPGSQENFKKSIKSGLHLVEFFAPWYA